MPRRKLPSSSYGACNNGIEDFPDPQVNGLGDIVLSPPVGVTDEELAEAGAVCEDILEFDGRTSESIWTASTPIRLGQLRPLTRELFR